MTEETIGPHVWDFDPDIHYDNPQDRGIGKRLYGERHRFDERSYTLHPDELQVGHDEPTSGSAEEFEAEMETEDRLRTVLGHLADNAGMHLRVYGRRVLTGDLLQVARDTIHNQRMNTIRNVNMQLDLNRRNQNN